MPDGSLIRTTRSNDQTTSAAVKALPLWNFTPLRSVHENVFRLPLKPHFVASTGCGVSPPGPASSRCWKISASAVAEPKS